MGQLNTTEGVYVQYDVTGYKKRSRDVRMPRDMRLVYEAKHCNHKRYCVYRSLNSCCRGGQSAYADSNTNAIKQKHLVVFSAVFDHLTHIPPPVPQICVNAPGYHWIRWWLVACSAPSHYLNQCCFIVNWTHENKSRWDLNRNFIIFIQEYAFENVVCQIGGHFLWRWGDELNKEPHTYITVLAMASFQVPQLEGLATLRARFVGQHGSHVGPMNLAIWVHSIIHHSPIHKIHQ